MSPKEKKLYRMTVNYFLLLLMGLNYFYSRTFSPAIFLLTIILVANLWGQLVIDVKEDKDLL